MVEEDHVLFRLADPDEALSEVLLLQEVRRPREGPPFRRTDDGSWELRFERPNALRIEYLLKLAHPDGGEEIIPDPGNPRQAPGPFGSKSVIEFAGYEAPTWLGKPLNGTVVDTSVRSRTLRSKLRTVIWTPEGHEPDAPLPLLVAHDGPEYSELSDLLTFLCDAISRGRVPPHRAALVAPVDRNETYSASAAYSRALAYEILPTLGRLAPAPHGRRMRIGMGASLGALAMLHQHRTHTAAFGALFLQSGSFFRQRFDKHESGFKRFGRISRFVGKVLAAEEWPHPIPVTMTCGTIEENLANNHAVAHALATQGYDIEMIENHDGHNWVGWRDVFDPHLSDLLAKAWG